MTGQNIRLNRLAAFIMAHRQATLSVLILLPVLVVCTLALKSLHSELLITQSQEESEAGFLTDYTGQVFDQYMNSQITGYFSGLENFLNDPNRLRIWTLNNNNIHFTAVYELTGEQTFPAQSDYQLIDEIFFLEKLTTQIDTGFLKGTFTHRHTAIVHDNTGMYLLTCDQVQNKVVCIIFTETQIQTWWQEIMSSVKLPGIRQLHVLIPGRDSWLHYPVNTTAELMQTTDLSVEPAPIKRSMSGIFTDWKASIILSPDRESPDPALSYYALIIAMITILTGSGYGLIQFERSRNQQLKDQIRFSAELAHELRTPLTNIRLYVDLIKHGQQQEITCHCQIIESEIDRLSLLVDNAIVLSRPEQREKQLYFEPANADRLIHSSVDLLRPLLQPRMGDIQLVSGSDLTLAFDADGLQRILINLLDNSRKYAQGADIKITTAQKNKQLVIHYYDTGPGISRTDWQLIAHQQSSRLQTQGFGLGLRVCIQLSQRSGGDFQWLESSNGSHFTIILPAHPVDKTSI